MKIYGAIQSVIGEAASTLDYREAINASVEFNVSPSYKEEMRELLKLENLQRALDAHHTVSKVFLNTQNKYEEVKIVRSGEHGMIFGFAEKDDDIREEIAQQEKLRQMNRQLEKHNKLQKLLGALAEEYSNVYGANLETDRMEVYKQSGRITDMFGESFVTSSFSEAAEAYVTNAVMEAYQPELKAALQPENMYRELEGVSSYKRVYRNNAGDYAEMKIVRTGEHTVIAGFAVKDAEIRRELRRSQERDEMEKVIYALAYEYTTVLSVNVHTGDMQIHKMTPHVDAVLGDLFRSKPYKEAMDVYFQVGIFEDDVKYVKDEGDLAHLKAELGWPDSISLIYRNKQERYGEEKIVRIDENTLVIGFADKDEEIRAELARKRELEEALDQAKAASQAKSDFLSNMSHDIRTPMNAINGYTDLALRHKEDRPLVDDSLHKISKASEQMLNLINDILDMSRIESGKMEVHPEPFSVSECIDNIRSMFASQATEKQLSFTADASEIQHDVVMCDRKMLDRVIMNLLSNAIKFTRDKGTVRMKVEELQTEGEDCALYRFIVADDGIGMSAEFLEKIFEPFEREQTSTVSKVQGTGLGMAIVGNLVKLLGGSIDIQSEPSKGTAFIIDLPLRYCDAKPVSRKRIEAMLLGSFEGKRVLLVEDMQINRELAKLVLHEQKLSVEVAENGKDALDMFRADPDQFDVILMDVQMPVMDGYEATRQIRALDLPAAKTIPIIAMTANAFAEDRQMAMDAGMNDHLTKPIDVGQLNRTLGKYLT